MQKPKQDKTNKIVEEFIYDSKTGKTQQYVFTDTITSGKSYEENQGMIYI